MIPGYQVLATRIRVELDDLDRSARRAERAWQAAQRAGSEQDMFIDSAALNLHGFYAGVERLCEAIAQQLDRSLPKGETWHRDLLEQMTLNLPGLRPPVMSAAGMQMLDE
jgi:HepT-like protein